VIAPIANKTVVALATVRAGERASNQYTFPEVRASHMPTYVIVPQLAVDSAKVAAAEFVNDALDALPQFVLLFVKETLAYEPPDGSVAPDPSILIVVVLRPK